MHLCMASSIRAMPEKEKPPAMRVDLYLLLGQFFIVVKYGGDGLIGGVLQNYHARSKEIML